MIILLRQISIPEFREHFLRYVVTFLGILLGVAIFTAIRSANRSLQTALRTTIDQIAGKAVLQVTSGQAGIPESIVDEIRAVAGVRAAVPIIEAVVRTADVRQGNILILGVDMTGDRSMRDYNIEGNDEDVADPLMFLAQPDSLMISKEFAVRNFLKEGDTVTLLTPLGNKTFIVRGIMAPKGMAKAFGGNIGVMDIYAAQFVFSRGRFFDRVDIALNEGIKIDDLLPRVQAKLGPGFKVEPPLRRGKQTESLMEAFAKTLFISSVMALLIGSFLIFNTFSVSVMQRRVQIGILRALGVTRAQIQCLFLGESVLLGLIGSAVGVIMGMFLGRAMMLFMATVVKQTYGVDVWVDKFHIDLHSSILPMILGMGTSVVGAYLPARAATRVDPILALQKGKFQATFMKENWRRCGIGGLLVVSCLGVVYSRWNQPFHIQLLIQATMLLGLMFLVPTLSYLLSKLLRYPMGWLFGLEGQLASDSLTQAPRRTNTTVIALMFSLSFVISSASLSASMKTSLLKWVDSSINSDIFVSTAESLTVRNFQFPAEMGTKLQNVPGVRQVDAVRIIKLDYAAATPLLVSIEMDQYLHRSTPIMEEGDVEDILPALLEKQGILISANFARLHRLHKGDDIILNTPSGRQAFKIAGVIVDYTSDQGTLRLDRRVYERLWKDDRVDTFDLMLEPGYDKDAVKQKIQQQFAHDRNIFVFTNKDVREEILRLTDQFWVLTYVQLMVALFVAVLGIFNSLLISIAERKREIGILRAMGGERSKVRKAIFLEAMGVGLVAIILGTVGGFTMGQYIVGTVGTSITGWVFPYAFPIRVIAALVPCVLITSALAAWYPSSLALKTPLVEALAYE